MLKFPPLLNAGVDPCAGAEPNIDEPTGCDVFVAKLGDGPKTDVVFDTVDPNMDGVVG